MKTLKEAGQEEIAALKRRTLRSLAMGRIDPPDAEYITKRCDEIEARIVSMSERSPDDRREF